jgi:serine/threonine protein kinase
MSETTGQNAVPQEPVAGFEKTVLDKGWVKPEQIAAAVKHQAEKRAAGEKLSLAQALVALGMITKDQVREAMSAQGEKASLRCPTCRKVFTVWGYKPGSKSLCKTCKVPLIPTGDTAAAALKEAGTGTEPMRAKVATSNDKALTATPVAKIATSNDQSLTETPVAAVATPLPVPAPAPATVSTASAPIEILQPGEAPKVQAPPAPPAAPVDPSLANLIAGYQIQRCVGSGAMGDVYLAKQTSLDRPVALKLLPQELAKNQEFVQRFLSEARSAAKLSHENIVQSVDVGESNGRYFFAMEMIDGATLQDILKRNTKLPEKQSLEFAKQIAKGLNHAHQMGLIHRDIKPANIMIHGEKTAKILDFGLAREVNSDVTLTIPGTVQSSPAYASPEQCRGVRTLDHRTDMYSLGVTLFEMLTGRRPFLADNAGALFIKHATEAPPSPQSLNSSISNGANQLVLRLLKKEPKQRFETYDQLVEAIDAVLSPKKPQLQKSSMPKPTRRMVMGKSSGMMPKIIGLAAASVLLGGAAFFYVKVFKPSQEGKSEVADTKKGATDNETQKILNAMVAMENKIDDNPASIPAVKARWKELVDQFKGTPQLARMVRGQQEFNARVSSLAETSATKTIAESAEKANDGRLIEAMNILRGYSPGFNGTEAQARIASQLTDVEHMLEDKYRNDRERLLQLHAAGKVEEARAMMPALRALVSWTEADGQIQFIRPELRNELDLLAVRISADVKPDPNATAKPAAPTEEAKQVAANPLPAGQPVVKAPAVKGPPPPIPDYVSVLRNSTQRNDPKIRPLAALGFKGLAQRSPLCRAAEVFLLHDEKFWKLTDSPPLAKAMNDYFATVPLERADTMSTAEHTGFFVSLAKKASDLGSGPKDVVYLFLLAHADELLAQNLRPDGEGIRLAGLQGAKASDFWGRPETVNRLALARIVTLNEVNPVELRRAVDPISTAIDFQSRYLCALATFRDKEFEPLAAANAWKRMAGMMADSSAGKFCDEVSDRLKKASICDGCAGVGKYACKKCMAMGLADCDKCKGTGRVPERPEAGFTSLYTVPCPACKQKGKVLCPICQGTKAQKCEKCDGKKTRKAVSGGEFVDVVAARLCASCNGSGNVFPRVAYPCPDCDGLGRQFPK